MFDDVENNGESQTFEFKDSKNLITDDDDTKLPLSHTYQKRNKYVMLILSFIVSVFLLYFISIETKVIGQAFHQLHGYLEEMYADNCIAVLGIILALLIVNYLLVLPTQTFINVISTFIINDPAKSFLILVFFSMIAATTVFLLCKYCFKDYLTKKFMGNALYDILAEESKIAPYKTAFMTRIILIPAGVKEYILSLTGNPYDSFAISGLFVHSFYVLEAVLIAQGVNDIHEYMTQKKSWSEKTTFEKASFFVIFSSVVFTIVILVVVGYWATKRVQAKKEIMKIIGDKKEI